MSDGRVLAIAAAAVTGGLFAAQPPLNAVVGRHTGVIAAAFVSLLVSTILVAVVLVASGSATELSKVTDVPPGYLLGGVIGAVNVTVGLIVVRSLGAGGAVAAAICGQLIVSALLDRFGVIGLDKIGLSPSRVIGMALLLAGTILVVRR